LVWWWGLAATDKHPVGVLRQHLCCPRGGGGGVVVLEFGSHSTAIPAAVVAWLWWWWVWVRVLVESCIVDASIFVVKLLRANGGCLGTRSR
jgi:hypothetical protein